MYNKNSSEFKKRNKNLLKWMQKIGQREREHDC